MSNEIRRIYNFMGGEVEDNPLAASATTFQSAGLANLPAVGSTEHVAIVFDPDWEEGAPFIKYITGHSAGVNTATITAAGQEGTTERQVSAGMRWTLAATSKDLRRWIRQGGSATDWSASGTALQPIGIPLEQCGVAPYSGVNSGGTFAITFPVPFAYPPLVVGLVAKGTVADTNVVAALSAVTTTTLTALIWSRTGAAGLGGDLHWTVRGEVVS